MNWPNLVAVGACWLIACVKLSVGECDKISVKGEAVIGVLVPVHTTEPSTSGTKCNQVNLRGVLMAEAILYALNEVNNKNHLPSNVTMGAEIRDSCKDSLIQTTYDFVGLSKVRAKAVIGKLRGDNKKKVIKLFSEIYDIPYISCNPSTYVNTKSTAHDQAFFRMEPTDKSNIEAILKFIANFNWTHVGVVADDDAVGRHSLQLFNQEAEKRNICVGGEFHFSSKPNKNDISSFIKNLNSGANFSVVVLLSSKDTSENILKSAYRQKLSGITWLAGQDSWEDTASVSRQNTAAGGMFKVGPSASLLPFKEHLRNLTKGAITNTWLCKLLSSDAATAAPPTASAQTTVAPVTTNAASDSTQDASVNSTAPTQITRAPTPQQSTAVPPTSQCDCSSGIPASANKAFVKDIINQLVAMAESEACLIDATFAVARAVNAKKSCKSDCPKQLTKYIQDVSFTSTTGHRVSFDNKKHLNEKEFHFYNYQNQTPITVNEMKHFKFVDVGTWKKSSGGEAELKIQKSRIRWNSGTVPKSRCEATCPVGKYLSFNSNHADGECCWKCTACPAGTINSKTDSLSCTACAEHWRPSDDKTDCVRFFEDYVHWDHPAALIVIFLMTAGVAFTFYVMITMVRNNDTPVVRNARNAINFLLPFMILMFLLPVPLLGRPTETTCEAYRAFFIIILGIPLAVFIGKSFVVEQAFYDENGQAKGNWRLCTPSCLVVLLVVVIHIIFAIVVAVALPVEVYRYPTKDPFVEYLECSTHSTFQILIAIIYVFVVAVIVSVMSLNELLTEQNHNEVKWISMCMFHFYAICFFYIIFTFRLYGKAKIIVLTFVCLLYAINYLGCVFLPKWYIIVFRPEQNQEDVSPWDVYQKSRDKISERLCHQEESPMPLRKVASNGKDGEKDTKSAESKELMSDTDL